LVRDRAEFGLLPILRRVDVAAAHAVIALVVWERRHKLHAALDEIVDAESEGRGAPRAGVHLPLAAGIVADAHHRLRQRLDVVLEAVAGVEHHVAGVSLLRGAGDAHDLVADVGSVCHQRPVDARGVLAEAELVVDEVVGEAERRIRAVGVGRRIVDALAAAAAGLRRIKPGVVYLLALDEHGGLGAAVLVDLLVILERHGDIGHAAATV
jgi:hypothetical protein